MHQLSNNPATPEGKLSVTPEGKLPVIPEGKLSVTPEGKLQEGSEGRDKPSPYRLQQINELDYLQQRIRSCRLCQEHGYIALAHPIVSGRVNDRIFIIGQAAGHRSVAKDRPFSGPAGQILQKWLEQAGFPPGYLHEHAYLSSLTRCDPGKSARGDGDRRPTPAEMALCRPYLDAELRIVRPKVILLVGTMAIDTFLGKSRLEDVIGTYAEKDGAFFLPLPHPSGVSRWLNDTEHKKLHEQALAILAGWRGDLGLG